MIPSQPSSLSLSSASLLFTSEQNQLYATLAYFNYQSTMVVRLLWIAPVSTLSVTYGSFQNYIWTFAAEYSKMARQILSASVPLIPFQLHLNLWFLWVGEHQRALIEVVPWWPFVGLTGVCKWEHLLWSRGPRFTTTLSQEVSNSIEVRMCHHHRPLSSEEIRVDQLEILIYWKQDFNIAKSPANYTVAVW